MGHHLTYYWMDILLCLEYLLLPTRFASYACLAYVLLASACLAVLSPRSPSALFCISVLELEATVCGGLVI